MLCVFHAPFKVSECQARAKQVPRLHFEAKGNVNDERPCCSTASAPASSTFLPRHTPDSPRQRGRPPAPPPPRPRPPGPAPAPAPPAAAEPPWGARPRSQARPRRRDPGAAAIACCGTVRLRRLRARPGSGGRRGRGCRRGGVRLDGAGGRAGLCRAAGCALCHGAALWGHAAHGAFLASSVLVFFSLL